MTTPRYQIGEVAETLGLSIRTIRHWDEMGVVEPSGRSSGGFRMYTDDDIARLRWVMRLKPMQFTLDQIRELLELKHRAATGSLDDNDRARLEFFALAAEASAGKLRQHFGWADDTATELRAAARKRQSGGVSRRHVATGRKRESRAQRGRQDPSRRTL